eukprot:1194367-Prorocentrum_minimum.AAC.2
MRGPPVGEVPGSGGSGGAPLLAVVAGSAGSEGGEGSHRVGPREGTCMRCGRDDRAGPPSRHPPEGAGGGRLRPHRGDGGVALQHDTDVAGEGLPRQHRVALRRWSAATSRRE